VSDVIAASIGNLIIRIRRGRQKPLTGEEDPQGAVTGLEEAGVPVVMGIGGELAGLVGQSCDLTADRPGGIIDLAVKYLDC